MSVAQTAIRVRRRWKNKFRHIAKLGRPIYPKPVSKDIAAERLKAVMDKENRMRARAKSK